MAAVASGVVPWQIVKAKRVVLAVAVKAVQVVGKAGPAAGRKVVRGEAKAVRRAVKAGREGARVAGVRVAAVAKVVVAKAGAVRVDLGAVTGSRPVG
jgi:hypothetical protein